MSALWAVAGLALLFVAFGLMNRGAVKPGCAGCEHAEDPARCGACPDSSGGARP